jgi:tetraacyldisaccharide 4'-kinase
LISAIYAAAARARRRWYDRHPDAQRRLSRPVVSVGNLTVGGSGKTPTVAYLARLLLSWGERPAVLSRGYGRPRPRDGVVVVREPDRVTSEFDESGDEPLMLARELDGATVLVSADRYLAGTLAERRFGCTVHLLDDGFQHLKLARDIDLLIVGGAELTGGGTLPSGRLREPLDAIQAADGVLVERTGQSETDVFDHSALRLSKKWGLTPFSSHATDDRPALALSAIARPERFVAHARASGWTIVDEVRFRDHHAFSRAEVESVVARARAVGAAVILTTSKDAIRLERHQALALPVVVLPYLVSIEPAADFEAWFRGRLAESGS